MRKVAPKTREMIILRAAKVLNAPYEAQANVQMLKTLDCLPRRSRLLLPTIRYPASIRSMFLCAKQAMNCRRAGHFCANFWKIR
jgi:hypothetical protein